MAVMSGGTADQGHTNLLQGDFGESWLEVVASAAGLLHGRPYRLDLQKTDVQIAAPGDESSDETTVQVQVKTKVGFTGLGDGTASFELDLATYEELRKIHHIRKLLAVIWLEREGDRVVVDDAGSMLVGRGAWMSLETLGATTNTDSVTVRLPLDNRLDALGLRRMLTTYGVPRSSQVPDMDWLTSDVDLWSGA